MVPSRNGSIHELVELARVGGEFEGTGLEIIPQVGSKFDQWAVDLMTDMSIAAQRPINWNVLLAKHENIDECLGKLAASDYARAKGGKVVALTMPISFGARLSFAGGFVLDVLPGWDVPMMSSRDEKLALLRDQAARDALNRQAQSPENPFPIVADWASKTIYDVVAPENEQYRGRTVGEIATELGREPFDVLCDIVVADELKTSFGYPAPPDTDDDWAARLSLWRDKRTVIGASDAGAHYDLLATFNYATGMLQGAVRQRGLLSFEEAVHLLTQVPAELYGIHERGLLREGWNADVVVFDPASIGSDDVAMRFDLPGGAGRLYAESTGVDHVLVNGSAIVSDGSLTETRAGTLLRSGRDTVTPSLN
jgi:N-acyl-D-aspartate/D-glutamate deacylase